MLADYAFYLAEYHGNLIPVNDFDRLILRAEAHLRALAPEAVTNPDKAVKMAACAVAEAVQTNEQGGDLQSQTVGSWSKSYARPDKPKTGQQRIVEAAELYLGNLSVRWA